MFVWGEAPRRQLLFRECRSAVGDIRQAWEFSFGKLATNWQEILSTQRQRQPGKALILSRKWGTYFGEFVAQQCAYRLALLKETHLLNIFTIAILFFTNCLLALTISSLRACRNFGTLTVVDEGLFGVSHLAPAPPLALFPGVRSPMSTAIRGAALADSPHPPTQLE